MKQRIITACIALPIFIAGMLCMFTVIFPFFVAFLSAYSAFELTRATQVKNKLLVIISIITAAAVPIAVYFRDYLTDVPFYAIITLYVIFFLSVGVFNFEKTGFDNILSSLFASFIFPMGFSSTILISQLYIDYPGVYDKAHCVFFIIFCFICAWGSDIFAYFIGRKFGKHKLAPVVSPHKSVEGFIGGIVGSAVLGVALLALFNFCVFENSEAVKYSQIAVIAMILAVAGVMGDLSLSAIKRKYGIKDYSNLLPGHGGVLDRFDSCLFVLPVLYSSVLVINLF